MNKPYLTAEMLKDRRNCGEDSDCNECSCLIAPDDCIYSHITTLYQSIMAMGPWKLALYLHSWQGEDKSVDDILDMLNNEHTNDTVYGSIVNGINEA